MNPDEPPVDDATLRRIARDVLSCDSCGLRLTQMVTPDGLIRLVCVCCDLLPHRGPKDCFHRG